MAKKPNNSKAEFQSAPPRVRGRLPICNPLSPSRKNDLRREPMDLIGFRTGVREMGSVKELIFRALSGSRTSG